MKQTARTGRRISSGDLFGRVSDVRTDLIKSASNLEFYYADIYRNATSLERMANELSTQEALAAASPRDRIAIQQLAEAVVRTSGALKTALLKTDFLHLVEAGAKKSYIRAVVRAYDRFERAALSFLRMYDQCCRAERPFAIALMEPDTAMYVIRSLGAEPLRWNRRTRPSTTTCR